MTKHIFRLSFGPLVLGLFAVSILLSPPDARACGPYCDMPGDRGGVAHYIDNAVACERLCDGQQQCRGWTWVKPGVQGPQAVCWIKSELKSTMRSDCCISGYRGDRSAAASVQQFKYTPLNAPKAMPPATGAQAPSAPTDSRPWCECKDERGAWYHPGFGQPCGYPLRDYEPKCRR